MLMSHAWDIQTAVFNKDGAITYDILPFKMPDIVASVNWTSGRRYNCRIKIQVLDFWRYILYIITLYYSKWSRKPSSLLEMMVTNFFGKTAGWTETGIFENSNKNTLYRLESKVTGSKQVAYFTERVRCQWRTNNIQYLVRLLLWQWLKKRVWRKRHGQEQY